MVSPNTSTTNTTTTATTTAAPSEAARPESKRTISARNLLSRTFSAGYDNDHSVRAGRWHLHPPAVARRAAAAPAPAPSPAPVHHHTHSGEDDDDASTIGELPGIAPIAPLARAVTVSYADLSYPSMTTDNRHGGYTDEYRAVSPTGVIPLVGSIYRPPTRDEGSSMPDPEEKLVVRNGHVVYEPEKKKKVPKTPELGKEQEAAHHRRFSWTVCRAAGCVSKDVTELVPADLVLSKTARAGEAPGHALSAKTRAIPLPHATVNVLRRPHPATVRRDVLLCCTSTREWSLPALLYLFVRRTLMYCIF
ncbi:hypothetical protein DENSPDRAFT_591680 [Dentipellis sp. KUC8613]|nr:hypothetical protein DENSPDRAFT_591680 [Dentipellis sp. KUC8613]